MTAALIMLASHRVNAERITLFHQDINCGTIASAVDKREQDSGAFVIGGTTWSKSRIFGAVYNDDGTCLERAVPFISFIHPTNS